ncbi:UDP-glucuronosyl/UDP-glucosyltransferase [Trema orientale]|uniref:Glycosyltransferase n=1 Tax=Trema orientale TaxID=63057 RepID=A0A2P5FCH5_TREOI|nr:UDP-glucuronosyl/UDP-glucosyltransferase [Trema orientale]
MVKPRFILVTFPAQGHINPALQLAKRLVRIYGSEVTFFTTLFAYRRMTKDNDDHNKSAPLPPNDMSFAPFSDGYDDGLAGDVNFDHYSSNLGRRGSRALAEVIESGVDEGRPYTCVVYTLLLPWAADVAAEHNIPAAPLWVQPATVFDVFYYCFHEYKDIVLDNSENPTMPLSFPGLPLLTIRDLPSLLTDSSAQSTLLIKFFRAPFEKLDEESNPKVLVNTFDELEYEALRSIGSNKMRLIAIGPLIPSAFCDGKDLSDTSFGGDLIRRPNDNYVEWLNSKDKTTVVYLSFGSYSVLSKPQMEEIAKGLLDFGHPFLWVIREKEPNDNKKESNDNDDVELSCRGELEKLGMIITWCSQVEVLSNESLGCFVSHCGWNSTLESLVCGVPMVAFPQWVDQKTNAKLVEDVWKTGVRVTPNEEGVVGGEEIKRCLELVMGGKENGVEIRRNAEKWKDLAREAVTEGGSSDRNFKAFVNEVIGDVGALSS